MEISREIRKNPEAMLKYILLKLEVLLELEQKYPPIDWNYHITEIIKDFGEESNEQIQDTQSR